MHHHETRSRIGKRCGCSAARRRDVAGCGAYFRYQVMQARAVDERLRPQPLDELRLRHRLGATIEQNLQ